MKRISVILLAAGQSSRMGVSKQLVVIDGETLLEGILRDIEQLELVDRVVVLGASAEAHREIVDRHEQIHVVMNPAWKNGIGSSLKAGLSFVKKNLDKAEAVLFVVCDQPDLTSDHLRAIVNTYRSGNFTIVASGYGETQGVPALFDRVHFDALLHLSDAEGAKKVIMQCDTRHKAIVLFKGGENDLDTPDDLKTYLHKKKPS